MEDYVLISWINDFIFCPASIYYHNLYEDTDKIIYTDLPQQKGTEYIPRSIKSVIQGQSIFYSPSTFAQTNIRFMAKSMFMILKLKLLLNGKRKSKRFMMVIFFRSMRSVYA